MTKVKPNAQLAVVTSVADQLKSVDEKLASLQKIVDTPYKTQGRLTGFDKNLKDETDVATLIRMFSSVKERERSYNESAEELGLDRYPSFKVDGANADEWKADIQLRLSIVKQKAIYDKLISIKKGITELMDKEDKLKLLEAELLTVQL